LIRSVKCQSIMQNRQYKVLDCNENTCLEMVVTGSQLNLVVCLRSQLPVGKK